MATAGFRTDPDFIVIGAKRGGTTSLYFHLLRHPSIMPLFPSGRFLPKKSPTKGIRFFDNKYSLGPRWYRSHFPLQATRRVHERRQAGAAVGEATPFYLFHPLAPERLADAFPTVKIVALLRDPVERCHSHYREQYRNGVEQLSFEEALDAEPERLLGEEERVRCEPGYRSFPLEHQAYVAQSEYDVAIARWFAAFPRRQVCVRRSEDYFAQPTQIVAEIVEFLGLSAKYTPSAPAMNAAPCTVMRECTRRRLEEHFAEHNRVLDSLLGQSLAWSG